jgi:hypothetical protein
MGIISAVNRIEFIIDATSYTIPRVHWCQIMILNVNAPAEDKSDDVKDSFYDKLERISRLSLNTIQMLC